MEKGLNVVFYVSEAPEEIGQEWLRAAGRLLKGALGEAGTRTPLLSRFCALAGHFALRLLVHIDVSYVRALPSSNIRAWKR